MGTKVHAASTALPLEPSTSNRPPWTERLGPRKWGRMP